MFSLLQKNRGSAFLITICLIGLLTLVAITAVDYSNTDVEVSFNQQHEEKAFYAAESGLARAMSVLKTDSDWRTGFANQSVGTEKYTVVVLDSLTQPSLKDTLLIRSTGNSESSRSIIEVLLVAAKFHPLYEHAIYAGNREEYDPNLPPDSQNYTYDIEFGGTGSDADSITGNVWMNGNAEVNGGAVINGSADVGGDFTGNTPTGGANTSVDYLKPPDLKAMNYETTANYKINGSSPWDGSGRIASTDPRHIFVKNFRTDLQPNKSFVFNNTNYFLGDPWEGSDLAEVSVSAAGNHKTYFVDGNLWMEPQGQTQSLIKSPSDGTQITIIVKGNIYFNDELNYDNDALDAVAFVAMTDGESYTDMDGDNQYDAGEPLLQDDGDGVYEGPKEGSGNVYFGDPNGGPLGHVHGYIYAENNFEDYVLDGTTGEPLDFEVTGMFSAGNLVRINRDFGGQHAQMKVNYDDRLIKGTINLPGLPLPDVTAGEWVAISWREAYM